MTGLNPLLLCLKRRLFLLSRGHWLRYFSGKRGLEIGGPSSIFAAGGLLPVYDAAGALDGVNFNSETVWNTGAYGDRYSYVPGRAPGRMYVREGSELDGIPDAAYDFLLGSHVLEHMANPLKALSEWHRVVRPGGALLLIVPDRRFTFDHARPVTEWEHLQEDLRAGTAESDLSHLEEILSLHDLGMDLPAGTPEAFRARGEMNLKNRCLHHHVFDMALAEKACTASGFNVIRRAALGMHLLLLCVRATGPASPGSGGSRPGLS